MVNSVINFDTVHFSHPFGSNNFANVLALFFQMFRLLNFKWDGSHRIRPSCDNFRSKLVDPSLTPESESTENAPQKPVEIVQESDQTDYMFQVSQLEEFCAKMTQYQAHMKDLEGILMQSREIEPFFKNGTSFLPPKMLSSRKKTSNSKQNVLNPVFRHLLYSTIIVIKFILLLILYLCLLFLNKTQSHRLTKLLSKFHLIIVIGSCLNSLRVESYQIKSKEFQILSNFYFGNLKKGSFVEFKVAMTLKYEQQEQNRA